MDDKIEKFNLPKDTKKYVDYKEMLKAEKPELVAICTESGKHGQIAFDCIEVGANLIMKSQSLYHLKKQI